MSGKQKKVQFNEKKSYKKARQESDSDQSGGT